MNILISIEKTISDHTEYQLNKLLYTAKNDWKSNEKFSLVNFENCNFKQEAITFLMENG